MAEEMERERQGQVARAVVKFLLSLEAVERGVGMHSGINVISQGVSEVAPGISPREVEDLVGILLRESQPLDPRVDHRRRSLIFKY